MPIDTPCSKSSSKPKLRSQLYDSVEALQADLDAWLHHYNHQRPHLGYRNQGRRPWDTVERSSASHPQDKEVRRQVMARNSPPKEEKK
jgi:Integrase core domain